MFLITTKVNSRALISKYLHKNKWRRKGNDSYISESNKNGANGHKSRKANWKACHFREKWNPHAARLKPQISLWKRKDIKMRIPRIYVAWFLYKFNLCEMHHHLPDARVSGKSTGNASFQLYVSAYANQLVHCSYVYLILKYSPNGRKCWWNKKRHFWFWCFWVMRSSFSE